VRSRLQARPAFASDAGRRSGLRARVASAVVAVPLLFAAAWFGFPWLSIAVALAAFLGALELNSILKVSNVRAWLYGTGWTIGMVALAHFDRKHALPVITAAVVFALIWQTAVPAKRRSPTEWLIMLGAPLYLGWLLAHFIYLRDLDHGREWVIFALFTTFACDTSAYGVGRAAGRHRMAPTLSPSKTWEGAAGGVAGAVLVALVMGWAFDLPISQAHVALMGLLVGVFAQLGDLAESALKRSGQVKDAGTLIPGHGGVLDRLDSLVFAVVVVYYYLDWMLT